MILCTDRNNILEEAQDEVKKMLSKLGLIEDEIKGAVVDEKIE